MDACSFCASARVDVRYLVCGPSVAICDACVERARDTAAVAAVLSPRTMPACTFCQSTHARAHFMGLHARVCEACIWLCSQVLESQRPEPQQPLPTARLHKG